jgi:hypothetical protein
MVCRERVKKKMSGARGIWDNYYIFIHVLQSQLLVALCNILLFVFPGEVRAEKESLQSRTEPGVAVFHRYEDSNFTTFSNNLPITNTLIKVGFYVLSPSFGFQTQSFIFVFQFRFIFCITKDSKL